MCLSYARSSDQRYKSVGCQCQFDFVNCPSPYKARFSKESCSAILYSLSFPIEHLLSAMTQCKIRIRLRIFCCLLVSASNSAFKYSSYSNATNFWCVFVSQDHDQCALEKLLHLLPILFNVFSKTMLLAISPNHFHLHTLPPS